MIFHHKKKYIKKCLLLYILFVCACAGQKNKFTYPVPDKKNDSEPVQIIEINEITENRDGSGAAYMPDWLTSFISGGIEEVEKLTSYQNRYLFIGRNKGGNFLALNKWAENFTVVQDFPRLAAVRIEKKLISAAALYPDDEYGDFYEALVKKAFSGEYPDAIKEETYWIKTMPNQVYDAAELAEEQERITAPSEVYIFFVFASIDKTTMQSIIKEMMDDTFASVKPTRAQNAAINRLRQTFFEGF